MLAGKTELESVRVLWTFCLGMGQIQLRDPGGAELILNCWASSTYSSSSHFRHKLPVIFPANWVDSKVVARAPTPLVNELTESASLVNFKCRRMWLSLGSLF